MLHGTGAGFGAVMLHKKTCMMRVTMTGGCCTISVQDDSAHVARFPCNNSGRESSSTGTDFDGNWIGADHSNNS